MARAADRTRATERARSLRRNSTLAESRLWYCLRDRRLGGFKFRRQVRLGRYIADFACVELRLIVELDGGQHAGQLERRYDGRRDTTLRSMGWHVLRFWNDDVLVRTHAVLEEIHRQVRAREAGTAAVISSKFEL